MERGNIGSLLIGAGMGAAIALLFARSSGTKVRAHLMKAAAGGGTYVKKYGETARGAVIDVVERTKDQVARHKEGAAEAIKKGSQAYRRVVG